MQCIHTTTSQSDHLVQIPSSQEEESERLTLNDDDLYPLLETRHNDPHHILGVHSLSNGHWIVRVWHPGARGVTLCVEGTKGVEMKTPFSYVHEAGLFEVEVEASIFEVGKPFAYTLEITNAHGVTSRIHDPYAFPPQIGDVDLYLHAQGKHWGMYHHLGAHPRTVEGVKGTVFAVWAPHAQRVSVVGDFNGWDGRFHMMRRLGHSGVWEIFLPGVDVGAHYKFEIRGPHGEILLKTDPYGFFAQHDLSTACMVYDLERYQWNDSSWMENRVKKDLYSLPLSIYEMHLGSWRRCPEEGDRPLSYRELAEELVDYVVEMGFTHVELLPVMEHPFEGSWGYQVVNFYAPSSRFGSPDEFRYLVDRLHQAGIGVILDWVPGHFPRDAHGLWRYDGATLYEYEDPRRGEHQEWGTMVFDYGRNEVRNFLIANALYWLAEFHIDGLRVDAVASMLYLDYSRKEGEWVPNQFGGRENLEAVSFIKECNELCYQRHPGIMMVAEESTAWPAVSKPTYLGGLGFGFKWNMGWMNDSLRYISRAPIHRKHHQNDITFSMIYAYHEHFILVLSHDEMVHGKGSLLSKMPEDDWQKFANVRFFLSWMWGHPGKKLIFQGGEFAQRDEWNHDHSLDWHLLGCDSHRGVQKLVQRLNHIYRSEPALWLLDDRPEGFEWIDFHDSENSVWSFLRRTLSPLVASEAPRGSDLIVIVNATPVVRYHYRIGVPVAGLYEIILNSDDTAFWGSGMMMPSFLHSEEQPCHRFAQSISLDLPPLSTLYLKVPRQAEK
ncbi:MAG TPA: 1,4-alpha-glucan branching protein GlgB [Chthoniobacterales bacterium]|nr:1,4-alpha-glucan branching protein GlgB [Chthoniobacterales bacterium]